MFNVRILSFRIVGRCALRNGIKLRREFSTNFIIKDSKILTSRLISSRHFSVSAVKFQDAAVKSVVAEKAIPISNPQEIVLNLPEQPVPIESTGVDIVTNFGDPPFEALGLASWWPSGRVQFLMEYIHVQLDVPWWGTIMISEFWHILDITG